MTQSTQDIQHEIDETKRQLISKAKILEEQLEERVERMTSWKLWVHDHPMTCVLASALVSYLIFRPHAAPKHVSHSSSTGGGSWIAQALARYTTGMVTAGVMKFVLSFILKNKTASASPYSN